VREARNQEMEKLKRLANWKKERRKEKK